MLTFLPRHLVALIGLLLHIFNVLACGIYVFALAPFKLLLPFPAAQRVVRKLLRRTPGLWSTINDVVIAVCMRIKWDVQIPENIAKDHSYLLVCNHQSWNDIAIVQKVFHRLLPPVVYFMKRELLWLPIVGWTCWLLDFPFMRRYSKQYLMKHPEKRGQDIAETKKTCEKYQHYPVTFVNYPEGTRFTQAKHDQQQSPFKHLLKSRPGGMALVLQAMQGQIKYIVNVTIVYPDGVKGFWAFLGGAIKRITVRAELIPVTAKLIGNYAHDEQFREQFQQWLMQVWAAKDQLITKLL